MEYYVYAVTFVLIITQPGFVISDRCSNECVWGTWGSWHCEGCCQVWSAPNSAYRYRSICCSAEPDIKTCLTKCHFYQNQTTDGGLCSMHCPCKPPPTTKPPIRWPPTPQVPMIIAAAHNKGTTRFRMSSVQPTQHAMYTSKVTQNNAQPIARQTTRGMMAQPQPTIRNPVPSSARPRDISSTVVKGTVTTATTSAKKTQPYPNTAYRTNAPIQGFSAQLSIPSPNIRIGDQNNHTKTQVRSNVSQTMHTVINNPLRIVRLVEMTDGVVTSDHVLSQSLVARADALSREERCLFECKGREDMYNCLVKCILRPCETLVNIAGPSLFVVGVIVGSSVTCCVYRILCKKQEQGKQGMVHPAKRVTAAMNF